jgi:molecular chaperone GrpE
MAESVEEKVTTNGDVGEQAPSSEQKPALDPVAEARAEAQRMKDQWIRTAADFDNFRKRARKEIDDARKAAREDLIKEFLPVFDNLERAGQSAQKATDVKAVADGVTMILKQFLDTLNRAGISRVVTAGATFDPQVHEAIQQVESDQPPGTIMAEVAPGYVNEGRLLRAAMVVVAKPKTSPEADEGNGSTPGGNEGESGRGRE